MKSISWLPCFIFVIFTYKNLVYLSTSTQKEEEKSFGKKHVLNK